MSEALKSPRPHSGNGTAQVPVTAVPEQEDLLHAFMAMRAEINQRLERIETNQKADRKFPELAGPPKVPDLSTRQKAILGLLCKGESNKHMGLVLNLPETTIKVHIREIMRKLSATNRTQAAIIATKMRLV